MDDSGNSEKQAITQALNFTKGYSRAKKLIFMLLSKVYMRDEIINHEPRHVLLELLVEVILNSILLSSLVLAENLKISNWDKYSAFWSALNYARVDVICFNFNYSQKCLIVSYVACISVASIWIFALILLKYKYKAAIIIFILRRLLRLIEIFSIPLVILNLIAIKYSWQGGTITEYQTNQQTDNIDGKLALSFISVLIILINAMSNIFFGYDSRHSFANKSIEAKSTGKIQGISKLCEYFTVAIYVFFAYENFILFRCKIIIIHMTALSLYYQRLPYYNNRLNYIKSLPHLVVTACSFYSLISYLIDDASFTLIGLICITPLLLMYMLMVFNKRVAGVNKMNPKLCEMDWEFELSIRHQLVNHSIDNEKNVIDEFEEYLLRINNDSSHILVFWLAAYCFYSCEKPELAMIKLTSKKTLEINNETQFHEYLLRKELKSLIYSQCTKYQLIIRTIKCQKIKALDKKLCILVLKYFQASQGKRLLLQMSEHILNSLFRSLKKILLKFEVASARFRDSRSLHEAYSSFAELFFRSSELTAAIKHRANGIMKKSSMSEDSNEENLFILVSAEEENFGIIIYIDPDFIKAFELQPVYYIGKPVISCFPENFEFFTVEKLKEFKSQVYEKTKYLECTAFIKFGNDYIKEVLINATLIAFSNLFFLFTFRSVKFNREIALLSSDNFVIGCTKGLKQVLKLDFEANYFDINSIINIDIPKLKLSETNAIKIDSIQTLVVYSENVILDKTISYLYFYPDESIYEEEKNNVEFYLDIDKHRMSSVSRIKFRNSVMLSIEPEGAETRLLESNSSKNSANSKMNSKLNQQLQVLMRSIKAFKIILLASVRFTQIGIVVCSNIIITVHLSLTVNDQLNYKGIEMLGSSIYSLVNIADMSSLIQVELTYYNNFTYKYQDNMQRALTKLKENYRNYSSFDSNWNYCPEAHSLFKEELPVYYQLNNTFMIRYVNAYDFFSEVISTTDRFISEINNRTNRINNEVVFFEFAAFGKTTEALINILKLVSHCELKLSHNFKDSISIMMTCGISTVAICGLVLIIISFSVNKQRADFWKNVRKISLISQEFKQACIERLDVIHCINNLLQEDDHEESLSNQAKRYTMGLGFFWRILVFTVLFSAYYIISYFNYYHEIIVILEARTEVFENLAISRKTLTDISFWNKATMFDGIVSPTRFTPEFSPFNTNYEISLLSSIEQLENSINLLKKEKYKKILGSKTYYSTFVSENATEVPSLWSGTYSATYSAIFDAIYIALSRNPDINVMYKIMYDLIIKLEYLNEQTFSIVIENSKSYIKETISSYILFGCFLCVGLICLFLLIFYPFLYSEINKLKGAKKICKIQLSRYTYKSSKSSD